MITLHPRLRTRSVLLLLASAACAGVGDAGLAPLVDHHVHLPSAALLEDWRELGAAFVRPDSEYTSPATLLGPPGSARDRDHLGGAVLVPMGHLYGRTEVRQPLGISPAEERAAVARENDHVAAEAARWPGRAIALCGVDFLRPYAWAELQRCRSELGSAGVKLHLASAGANLDYASHLAELRRIAEWVSQEQMILLLHFDPQGSRGQVDDIERFIASVLQPFPELRVTIAHLGGSGGFDAWTRTIFDTFAEWLDRESAAGRARPGVRFDVSGVWLAEDTEAMPRSTPQDADALASTLARVGMGRMLFGSDHPVFDPIGYATAFRTAARLSPAAWDSLVQNRIPGFPAATPDN